jgi:hypothetical protein
MFPPDQPETSYIVRIARSLEGRFVGFRGEGGRFITRESAAKGLVFDDKTGLIRDQAGNTAGVGSLAIPGRGITVTTATGKIVSYERVSVPIDHLTVQSNQMIQERLVLRDDKGKIYNYYGNYALGEKYDPKKLGKWYIRSLNEVAEKEGKKKISYDKLDQYIVLHEYRVVTITP